MYIARVKAAEEGESPGVPRNVSKIF